MIETREEKLRLNAVRSKAVCEAWKIEVSRVLEGRGTRDWSLEQQTELLSKGKIKGYHGHHMCSVDLYNEYAGTPENIQFLTREEHFIAHNQHGIFKMVGGYQNPTNGYYCPTNQVMKEFGNEIQKIPEIELTNKLCKTKDRERYPHLYEKKQIERGRGR